MGKGFSKSEEVTQPEIGLSKRESKVVIPKFRKGDLVRIKKAGIDRRIEKIDLTYRVCMSEQAPYGLMVGGFLLYYAESELELICAG